MSDWEVPQGPEVHKAIRTGATPVSPAEMIRRLALLKTCLPQFGVEELRQGQDSIIHSVVCGYDVIGLLPTGHGKSMTYQLPCVAMQWKVLVVSPLLALLDDQVRSSLKKGIKAVALSSNNEDAQNAYYLAEWAKGNIDMLFTVPERLQNRTFVEVIKQRVPDMLVVDEAHVIGQWADNFRPAYSKIDEFITALGNNLKVVLALTATATDETEQAIKDYLGMHNARRICYMPERKNLSSETRRASSDYDLFRAIEGYDDDEPIIVYCATTKNVERVAAALTSKGYSGVTMYHGQLDANSKKANQRAFFEGKARIMVATNAFGMGIDKSNIRGVIHYDTPQTVEALVQEQGRAGRDGLPSRNIILVRPESRRTHEFMLPSSNPEPKQIKKVYESMRKMADADNRVDASHKDIAFQAGVSDYGIHSIMSLLFRYGVLSKVAANSDLATISVFRKSGDPNTDRYLDAFIKYGTGPRDNMKVSIGAVAKYLSVQPSTIYANLRTWQKMSDGSLVKFEPPPKGYIQILAGLDKVDMDAIEERRARAFDKLDQVDEFINVPEHKKHAWLKNYFAA